MNIRPLLFVFFLVAAARASAAENPYDVLGKTLAPFVNLLARETHSPNRALALDLRVLAATKLPPELANATASIALQYPDKLLLRGPLLGEPVTICRDGQNLWAAPGAKIAALINAAHLPKAKKEEVLADFALPIPEKQLVFLPVLFQVADGGNEMLGRENCRVLDVRLMPQLAHSLKVEAWSARLWVRADDRPAQLELNGPNWHGTFAFDQVNFAPALPPETWQPAPGETDVTKLTATQFKQLFDAVSGAARP